MAEVRKSVLLRLPESLKEELDREAKMSALPVNDVVIEGIILRCRLGGKSKLAWVLWKLGHRRRGYTPDEQTVLTFQNQGLGRTRACFGREY